MSKELGKVLHLRPLGPQGPRLSVALSGKEDMQKLDEEIGNLKSEERKSFAGLRKATLKAGLSAVDS